MADSTVLNMLEACFQGDIETLLVLGDYLEDIGDSRSAQVRGLYETLWGEWVFAPKAFQYHEVARQMLTSTFPECPISPIPIN